MKLKINPYIDGKPQEIEVTAYEAIQSHGNFWYLVTNGKGRYWRVKKERKR